LAASKLSARNVLLEIFYRPMSNGDPAKELYGIAVGSNLGFDAVVCFGLWTAQTIPEFFIVKAR
jgi:hypothetical protein